MSAPEAPAPSLTVDELTHGEQNWIARHNARARTKSCYRFCPLCGNCENYDSRLVKCSRCFVDVYCLCRQGIRLWLDQRGFRCFRRVGFAAFRYGSEQGRIDVGGPVRRF